MLVTQLAVVLLCIDVAGEGVALLDIVIDLDFFRHVLKLILIMSITEGRKASMMREVSVREYMTFRVSDKNCRQSTNKPPCNEQIKKVLISSSSLSLFLMM